MATIAAITHNSTPHIDMIDPIDQRGYTIRYHEKTRRRETPFEQTRRGNASGGGNVEQ
jgi:hypothetical protein